LTLLCLSYRFSSQVVFVAKIDKTLKYIKMVTKFIPYTQMLGSRLKRSASRAVDDHDITHIYSDGRLNEQEFPTNTKLFVDMAASMSRNRAIIVINMLTLLLFPLISAHDEREKPNLTGKCLFLTIISLGTQFAGGAFLAMTLMNSWSDSAEMFKDLTGKEYPLAFMLLSAGYLFTMLGD
ncbi:hypothetical protein KI387_026387, partial [Taxus chinensis]